jgi:hypothetical protein
VTHLRKLAPVLVLCSACDRGTSITSSAPTPVASVNAHATAAAIISEAPAPSAGTPSVPPSGGGVPRAAVLGPPVIVPPIPAVQAGMMDHLLPNAGCTKDGSTLGYWVSLAANLECEIWGIGR